MYQPKKPQKPIKNKGFSIKGYENNHFHKVSVTGPRDRMPLRLYIYERRTSPVSIYVGYVSIVFLIKLVRKSIRKALCAAVWLLSY